MNRDDLGKKRPEHRAIDPHADDVVDLGRREGPNDAKVRLKCTSCRPSRTRPVRKTDDPKTVVRCADCGKKHGKDSLTVDGSNADLV